MFSELKQAWRMYRSDSRAETVAALVLAIAVAAPVVREIWEVRRAW
jgi:hypothetical protein